MQTPLADSNPSTASHSSSRAPAQRKGAGARQRSRGRSQRATKRRLIPSRGVRRPCSLSVGHDEDGPGRVLEEPWSTNAAGGSDLRLVAQGNTNREIAAQLSLVRLGRVPPAQGVPQAGSEVAHAACTPYGVMAFGLSSGAAKAGYASCREGRRGRMRPRRCSTSSSPHWARVSG